FVSKAVTSRSNSGGRRTNTIGSPRWPLCRQKHSSPPSCCDEVETLAYGMIAALPPRRFAPSFHQRLYRIVAVGVAVAQLYGLGKGCASGRGRAGTAKHGTGR